MAVYTARRVTFYHRGNDNENIHISITYYYSGRVISDAFKVYPAPAGEGYLPIKEYVSSLKALGYDGYLTVEHFGARDQEDYLSRSAISLKRMTNE